ncbi:p53-induced death domain-containing protein 1 isoform X2 [Salmo trutta]|uniref:p53-induced death domain-containing protein 1 isoform X2 n=1 Tax=Salmo trutta TaxID=8032 RepID=UPI001131D7B3|nr:p53-induced death domain-containing protein 1-like isoform X2 [Salmo trutta]
MEREKKKKWRRGRGQEKTEGENQVGGGTIETGHDPLDQMRNKTVNRITHFPIDKMGHHLGEEVSRREGQTEGEGETASVSAIRNKEESGIQMGTEKMEEMNKGLITVTDRDNDDGDPVSIPPSLSISPPSISPLSISTLSSPSPYFQPPLSSFSPVPSLTPPLPPSVELCAVLTDTRLTLDVYHGGTAVLQVLWVSVPGQLRGLQYLRLGSEDRGALEGALEVLPHLTQLRSLAIRGHCFHDAHGDPLPGLLTSLPPSLSSLSLLVHLDLSFNLLSSFPPCLLTLPLLSTLLLGHNHLTDLPPSFSPLPALRYLSLLGNSLASLPPSLGQLKSLHTLDVSYNLLETLPEEIGALEELVKLELSHNRLKRLPETMGCLLSLRDLVIHSNDLRVLPVCLCLDKLDKLKVDVRNNPLGRPPTPPPLPPTPDQVETRVPELHLGLNRHRFCVSSAGCHVFLPGGAELLFPSGCLATTTTLQWAERMPDRKWVWLEEHDFLLSRPLELLPHRISFLKPVEVCVPYHRSRRGEVVVRRFDGQQWSTLPTETRRGSIGHSSHPGGRPARLACVSVRQFSWFVAVGRPVRDSCSVTPEGALLVSRTDAGIKLTFPPDCTVQTRTITLQVLQVSVTEVQTLCGDPQARVSPLLCLSQDPSIQFLQPIKVQVPLPTGLAGHTVDLSCLHLLHGDPSAHTWTDITSQVSLYVTQLYAIFYITHFSWYWLWYTTQRCVSGVVRRVYQRLKQFQVQFLVLQRRTDPKQVLLQCLPADKVDNRVQSLSEQYDGPQPSDLCDLLEGEQFFAGFERGLDVSADRPDCAEGRLSFVFYSRLKNLKEVYVCPTQKQEGSIRGQVSFYRGEVPSDIPQEVARKRKGHDSQWLATLPLRLPGLNSEGGSNGMDWEQPQYPPLNLGDPESGYLTEANLLAISLQIGQDWRSIGINLGISYQELDRIQYKYRDNLGALVLEMLFHWARGQQQEGVGLRPAGGPGQKGIGAVPRLVDAMVESDRRDLAEEIKDIVRLGTRKYNESLRRVGLEEEEKRPSTETDPSPSH